MITFESPHSILNTVNTCHKITDVSYRLIRKGVNTLPRLVPLLQ